FVVLDRTEDAGAEQAVTLGLERAVIDRLRLLDLAEGPAADLVGRRDADPDLVESLGLGDRVREVRQFVHFFFLMTLSPSGERKSRRRRRRRGGVSARDCPSPRPSPPRGRGRLIIQQPRRSAPR